MAGTVRRSAGGGLGPMGRPPRRPRYPCLCGAGPQLESLPDLLQLLPPDFSYHVCSYEPLPGGFAATLRVNFSSERGARDWLAAFQQSSLTTYRSRRTFPRPGPRLLYKAWFRCQRNVPGSRAAAGDGSDARHTACPAALAISVCGPQVTRRADPHLPDSPGCVTLKHVHNHPVRCAADLRFRGISSATRGALQALLARGYAPAAARRALRHQLQLQLGERFPLVAAADRAVLPSLKDVCRIHYQQSGTPAQRRAAAAAAGYSVEAEEDSDGGGDERDDDEPDTATHPFQHMPNPERLKRREVVVAGVGVGEGSGEPVGLQVELVDSDSIVFESEVTDRQYTVMEQTESANPMSESRTTSVPPSSSHLTLHSAGHETADADRAEDGELIVERPSDLTLDSADDATVELELVDPENPAETDADEDERLPSLESLLASSTAPDPRAVSARLERLVAEYTEVMSDSGGTAAFVRLEGCRFAAALTTHLMRRVHLEVPQSGELVFVDSPGRSERHGCCLWLVVCASEAGALPLGLLMASSDSGTELRAALQLWMRTLPPGAFSGRGADGPQVVITDDGAGQRAALAARFPQALAVLCSFRLLQAVWRWLWQARGRLASAERSRLLHLARRLLCAGSVAQLERRYREAVSDSTMARHADFRKQFTSIYHHRHLWAVWYGEEEASDIEPSASERAAPSRTASLFDLAASLLRDRLLFMASEYGPAEAFDFWTRRGDVYFLERIERALAGSSEAPSSHPRYVPPPPGVRLRARRSGPHEHEVTEGDGDGAVFQLDLELGCCTCRLGRRGAPCAHQSAAARLERERGPPTATVDAEAAARLWRLIERLPLLDPGPDPLPDGWLQAVTAAAGLSSLEVVLSSEQDSNPELAPPPQSEYETAEDSVALQMQDGDANVVTAPHNSPPLEHVNPLANSAPDVAAGAELGMDLGTELGTDPTEPGLTPPPADPAEEAMSAAIVALQEVAADLTGRLAAEPERYVPLVRDLVARYWQLEGEDGPRAVSERLTELREEAEAGQVAPP